MNDSQLLKSYDTKFKQAIDLGRLTRSDIQSSLDLFDFKEGQPPSPKYLSVFALISGRSFHSSIIRNIVKHQEALRSILSGTTYYLVKPDNLAVEHCVFKWPNDILHPSLDSIETDPLLINQFPSKFYLQPYGIQFHSDGCLILRCVDSDSSIRTFRSALARSFPHMPTRQSSWAHIPLGRILSPLTDDTFKSLSMYCTSSQSIVSKPFLIDEIKLVHEHQWYMESVDVLLAHHLS